MQIKLHLQRTSGSVLLGVLIIAVGLLIGGCVIKKVISKVKDVQKKIDQIATNVPPDELVIFRQTATQFFPPVENAVSPSPSVAPKFQVNTNDYNEALEDESGF